METTAEIPELQLLSCDQYSPKKEKEIPVASVVALVVASGSILGADTYCRIEAHGFPLHVIFGSESSQSGYRRYLFVRFRCSIIRLQCYSGTEKL